MRPLYTTHVGLLMLGVAIVAAGGWLVDDAQDDSTGGLACRVLAFSTSASRHSSSRSWRWPCALMPKRQGKPERDPGAGHDRQAVRPPQRRWRGRRRRPLQAARMAAGPGDAAVAGQRSQYHAAQAGRGGQPRALDAGPDADGQGTRSDRTRLARRPVRAAGTRRCSCLAGGAGAAAGFFLPDVLLYNSGLKRQQRLAVSLPDALDLLTICVEAGLGFDAALAQVARNLKGPLAAEFARVLQEMQIGKSRAEAMRAHGRAQPACQSCGRSSRP